MVIIETHCQYCGAEFPEPPKSGGALGFATETDSAGARRFICYACADAAERRRIGDTSVLAFVGYLSRDCAHVTTWTGGALATVTRRTYGRTRQRPIVSIRATTPDGRRWYGRGAGKGMIITMHRAKR